VINSRNADPVAGIQELTGGFGADVVIEALGRRKPTSRPLRP